MMFEPFNSSTNVSAAGLHCNRILKKAETYKLVTQSPEGKHRNKKQF